MKNQVQPNAPISGMDRDSHPSRVKENSFTFARNISLEDSSGNGFPLVQNEPSNVLCENFKAAFDNIGGISAYKIVGHRYNATLGRTYFFFTNETEGNPFQGTSAFGYFTKHIDMFDSQDSESVCGCFHIKNLDGPMEDSEFESTCDFKLLFEDSCSRGDNGDGTFSKGCLNLSIDYPIYERNIRFKNEQCGRRMYWTDRLNPPRYLDLDLIEVKNWKENDYFHTGQIVCGKEINYREWCFDCDKISMLPNYGVPCLMPIDIVLGGNLKLGTYEFLIAYCDEEGNELSDYYSHTNPINLFDYNNVVMNQTGQDNTTNYAIKLEASELDESFHFYKIAVVEHTEVNGEESYFVEGIHPITDRSILYTTNRNKQRITLNKLLIRRFRLQSTEQMVDSNGYLFLAGLKHKPVINFQPIVNLMGPYLKWSTVIAKQDFYKNGINASTSRSYMRDETYPFSICFGTKDGYESNDFILIGRAPTDSDLESYVNVEYKTDSQGHTHEVGYTPKNPKNLNVRSILKGKNACGGVERRLKWQFENTAEVKGESTSMPRCNTPTEKRAYIDSLLSNGEVFTKTDIKTCSILTMADDEGNLNIGQNFMVRVGGDYRSNISLFDYIITHKDRYLDPMNMFYNTKIKELLDVNRYSQFHCTTSQSCNCIDTKLIKAYTELYSATFQDTPENTVYKPEIEELDLPFNESQFPEGARDIDYRLTSKYILPGYGEIHNRPSTRLVQACVQAERILDYNTMIPEEEDGVFVPIVGSRSKTKLQSQLLYEQYKSVPTSVYNYAISASYFEGGGVTNGKKKEKKKKQRYADEVWNILRGETFFMGHVAKSAIWLESKDLTESNVIEIQTSSSLVKDIIQEEEDGIQLSDNVSTDDDVAYNELQLIRVSIFDRCSEDVDDVKTPLKVLFLSSKVNHLLDLAQILGRTSGSYILAIDTPIIQLRHFKAAFRRRFSRMSDKYPDGQETPPALRYMYKVRKYSAKLGYTTSFFVAANVNEDGSPTVNEQQAAVLSNGSGGIAEFIAIPFDESDYWGGRRNVAPIDDPLTSNGGTTVTTTDENGNVTVVNPDGSSVTTVTTTVTNPDGTTSTVKTETETEGEGFDEDTLMNQQSYQEYDNASYITSGLDWSLLVYHRGHEPLYFEYMVNDLMVIKKEDYSRDCYFEVLDVCEGTPFEEGKFAYIESTEDYPDNVELFNSHKLGITEAMIDSAVSKYEKWSDKIFVNSDETFKSVFIDNFGTWEDRNAGRIEEVMSKDRTDFTCKPIRHFKFPDNSISPFMYTNEALNYQDTLIFPLGVSIDAAVVNIMLDLAVETGLLTRAEREAIVYFKLKRGDRTLDKTVLAKGLLTDMIRYKEMDGYRFFANFPYNDLGPHELLKNPNGQTITHQYRGKYNNMFAFNSPDIDFGMTVNPSEVTVEGYQYGVAETQVNKVRGHAKMVLLSDKAINTANTLARVESTFEVMSKVAELGIGAAQAMSGGGFFGFSGIAAGAIGAGLVAAVTALRAPMISNRTAELRNKWIDIFKNQGIGSNFAHYITSVGHYNNYTPETLKYNDLRRVVKSVKLDEGVYNLHEPYADGLIKINNIDREKSLFLYLGNQAVLDGISYPPSFMDIDNSGVEPDAQTIRSVYETDVANLYSGIKVWKASQYGLVENIKWIDINSCNRLVDNVGEKEVGNIVMFGGDTFISKYAYKRKFNFFLVSDMNQADFTPFKYSQYFNVGKPKYYIDYETEDSRYGKSIITTKSSKWKIKFEEVKGNYITDGWFFHYQYGIPYFFVESTINCWNRYAGEDRWMDFYPHVGDYVEWTQEDVVSIRKPNVFRYNYIYSMSGMPKNNNFLPNNFVSKFYNCTNNSPNGIAYTSQDVSEKQKVDPWLVFKNFDFYNFPTSNGKLIDLVNIESTQILALFENQATIFNAVDVLKDRITPQTAELGTGGIFASRPKDFHRTDLGYGGTQHKIVVSTEFGHFWVDARRGQVFQVDPNGNGLTEITAGLRNWFKEHLPFKILKGKVEGLTDIDLDNPYKNLGISMGWDSRYKRIFLTKLDYIVKPSWVGKLEFAYRDGYKDVDVDLDFLSVNKYFRIKETQEEVELTDTKYFEPVHFTLAYSPIFKSWISYYDFYPAFYISYDNYFDTGSNYPVSSKLSGPSVWSHLLTNKSYGVFFGKKYGWEVELPTNEQYTQKMLNNVEFWLDTLRYQNEYDYAIHTNRTLDSVFIYNQKESTGKLKLTPRQINNRRQTIDYPKVNLDSTDILVTYSEGKWSFNDFFNRVAKDNTNVPLWLYDKNAIHKTSNTKALNYKSRWLDRLRGDWFLIRFEGGSDSRFKQMFKWMVPHDNIII